MSIAAMNDAWKEKLKPTHKLVLMALADAADDECYCWPSVPTLARKTCMDERSVQRILRSLEGYGLLKVEPRFRNDGSATTNGYHLILGGDKLSPPQRQSKHQVVAITPPPSGIAVTQTTTESSFNQKPPLHASETANTSSSDTDYIYPSQLKPEERKLAKPQLDSIDQILAQAVLDELAARLNANRVTGAPLSYLRSLITRARAGQFTPEAGVRIAAAREQAKFDKLKKSTEAPKPTDSKEIPKHLAAMHQALGRRQPSSQQELP